jgi:UDP-GlcNAc:undecaprenyl-phosphate GlcNAc-1-phosphate transferase
MSTVLALLALGLAVILALPPVRVHFTGQNIRWLYVLALSFSISFFLNRVFLPLGHRFNLLDEPDSRKQHQGPTPLTGGLAIIIAFILTLLLNFHFSWNMKGIIIGSGLVFLGGFLDDWFGLSARLRLVLQLLAAGVVIYFGVRVTFIPDYLGGVYTEAVITTIWLLGITNSMNFLDGMDGLASGITIIVTGFLAIFAYRTHQMSFLLTVMALVGGCAGFFPFNFRRRGPALTFLGDGGANFIGFFLASVAIMADWAENNPRDLAVPAVIMGVLIFDMTLTTITRIKSGKVRSFPEWIHYTGRDHFHHMLTNMGFTSRQSVILIFLACFVSGFGGMALKNSGGWDTVFIILQSVSFYLLIAFLMFRR